MVWEVIFLSFLFNFACLTISTDAQLPNLHNEGTSDGPPANMDPMMAIKQELQRMHYMEKETLFATVLITVAKSFNLLPLFLTAFK